MVHPHHILTTVPLSTTPSACTLLSSLCKSLLPARPWHNLFLPIKPKWTCRFCTCALVLTMAYIVRNHLLIFQQRHTEAILTFRFHKKSGFVRVILKANFNWTYKPNPSFFWAGNSDLSYSFSSIFCGICQICTLVFTHCCCYTKELTYLNCNFCIKSQFKHINSLK